jgi:hypothetical protein
MSYRVHRENTVPFPGSHIIGETAPLAIVETQEEAKQVMLSLMAGGIRPRELYAVGYEKT